MIIYNRAVTAEQVAPFFKDHHHPFHQAKFTSEHVLYLWESGALTETPFLDAPSLAPQQDRAWLDFIEGVLGFARPADLELK